MLQKKKDCRKNIELFPFELCQNNFSIPACYIQFFLPPLQILEIFYQLHQFGKIPTKIIFLDSNNNKNKQSLECNKEFKIKNNNPNLSFLSTDTDLKNSSLDITGQNLGMGMASRLFCCSIMIVLFGTLFLTLVFFFYFCQFIYIDPSSNKKFLSHYTIKF